MSKYLSYLGQLRLYSFVDLFLLLYVTGAQGWVLAGAVCLWLGFIVYLESAHQHEYRARFPKSAWLVLLIAGLALYARVEGLLFLLFSYFYAKKTEGNYGLVAPLLRGLQMFVLVGGLVGYERLLPWLVFILITLRNLLGDFRDIEKDKNEGMRTLPILLGWTNGVTRIHFHFLLFTSLVWWALSGLNILYLVLVWAVQFFTYGLTERQAR